MERRAGLLSPGASDALVAASAAAVARARTLTLTLVSDGVLLVVAMEDRRSRVDVGYDLEGDLTDGEAREILGGMGPALRAGRIGRAVAGAVRSVIGQAGGLEPATVGSGSSESSWPSSGSGASSSSTSWGGGAGSFGGGASSSW